MCFIRGKHLVTCLSARYSKDNNQNCLYSVLFLSEFCLTSLPLDLWPCALALPCSRVNLGSAACCLTLTLCCQRKNLQRITFLPPKMPSAPFGWLQTCCCTAPLTHCTAEDGVIDLNDAAKRSSSISQMFSSAISASVKDWTRSVLCMEGLETGTNSHMWPRSDGSPAVC